MIKSTPTELGGVFRGIVNRVAATKSPPPVHLTVTDGTEQLNTGYVWCDYQGTTVRCQVTSSNDYTVSGHVILAIPLGSGATNDYVEIGSIYNGADGSRFPRIRVSSISDANGDPISGVGTVTSVGLSATPASVFGVASSPVTGSGTIALSLDDQNANEVLSGPSSGGAAEPAFRALVADDIPTLTIAKISDIVYQVIKDNGTPLTARAAINFIAGSNVTLTIADDGGSNETDITIASAGGASADDQAFAVFTGT